MDPAHYRLDTVVHDETLADAAALGAAWKLPVEEHAGRPAVRIDLEGPGRPFELPLPRRDFDALDQFSFDFCTAPGTTAEPRLNLNLASRTSGLPRNDYFSSGVPEPLASEAWRAWLVPYENFLIYGIPSGVRGVEKAILNVSGRGAVWIGGWSGQRRARAAGPRLTGAGLLAALDLERPELDGVRRAARGGDEAGALAELLRRLKARAAPRHIFGRAEAPAEADLAEAERICANVINGFDVGTPVDWRANPNGYLEWMHAFNRTGFFMKLLHAYRKTGEAKYARKLDELFASWIAANPEPVAHNGGGDPAWETLSTAVRIYGSWLECFFALLHDANFSDAARLALLRSFHGHAEHLTRYKGYANNWFIVESRVLALLGMIFPEFRRANAWAEEGIKRLEGELTRQIFPDGADWELAPGYHMMAVAGFLDVYEVAKLNGRALPAAYDERLPKTFEYIAGLTRPDGSLPSVNDSGGYRARNGGEFLMRGARLFGRPEFAASAEGPYAGRSRAFPDCGFHVLAGGTGRAAKWLLFDAGPFGASHQHEDALGLELFAHGSPFVVDPGISGYMNDDWTAFYRHTRAHSTLLVNGAGQNRRAVTQHHHAESVRGQCEAAFSPVLDFARAVYRDGYEGQPAGIEHERTVIFVREDYYLVFDEVRGAAAERIEALFHFAPMRVELESRTRRARSMRLAGPNLELIPLEPRQGLKVELTCGETCPVQGWVADGGDFPAPVVRYLVRGRAPLRFAAALVPYAKGLDAGVEVGRLPKMPAGVMGLKLSFAGGRSDRVFLRQEPDARLPGATPLDADLRLERYDAKGKRVAAAWAKGNAITVEQI
ncbi:MAG: heparinase II/III family protein [Planctomycetota bacterium]|nr:heparinase II/III family protein [Planctomycetota bacterium]